MKKLTLNELMDIADEISKEVYPNDNEDTKTQETISCAIFSMIALFMEKYQKKAYETD